MVEGRGAEEVDTAGRGVKGAKLELWRREWSPSWKNDEPVLVKAGHEPLASDDQGRFRTPLLPPDAAYRIATDFTAPTVCIVKQANPTGLASNDRLAEAYQKALAGDPAIDLEARIPHGTGQTYLRELLLVADHNAYHLGELIVVRRLLGAWR